MKFSICLFAATAAMCGLFSTSVNAQVWTYHNNNRRTGETTNETILNLTNVNSTSFGRLFTNAVDGCVYAQPLYMPGVAIPGQGTHNILIIATEHNTVYGFDADVPVVAGGLLWKTNLGPAAVTTTGTYTNKNFGTRYNGGAYTDIEPEVGITGTPVIDTNSGTLYVDAFTGVVGGGVTNYFHTMHALNITNGMEQSFSPVVITDSVAGTGVDSVSGRVTFNAKQENQRCALTLAGGIVYVAYAGYADTDPYHGWVIGFNATNLAQLTNYVFNASPNATTATFGANAGEAGIWMGGGGLSVDDSTNLYFETGNGSFSATNNSGHTDFGDCFMKLSTTNGLKVADYFAPWNQAALQAADTDLGSGGLLLLPAQSGPYMNVLVGAGKQGQIYVINRDQFTTENNHYDSTNHFDFVVQTNIGKINGSFDTPAYFNGRIYYAASGDNMKSFAVTNGALAGNTIHTNKNRTFNFPGATPTITANGTNNAIVWALQMPSTLGNAATLVAAYATNIATELYNSGQAAGNRDVLGAGVKFAVPTVADGKVFVGSSNSISVFGLLAGTVAFSSPAYTVVKNAGPAIVTVSRISGTNGAISVAYATVAGGTAVGGTDYVNTNGTLNWTNGESAQKTFTVSILNNGQPSTNLTINLALSAPGGGAGLDAQSTAILTILPSPTVFTLTATNITTNSATLNGSVYPNGAATTAWFQWGITTNYGNVTTITNLGGGTSAVAVGNMLTNLQPGTIYYFATAATNIYGTGTVTGTNFVTLDVPRAISGLTQIALGQFTLQFIGSSNVGYSVLGTTNVALPISNWMTLGTAALISNNEFQFIDTLATNVPLRYYRLRSP